MTINPTNIDILSLINKLGVAKRKLEVKEYSDTVTVGSQSTTSINISTSEGFVGLIITAKARFKNDTGNSSSYIKIKLGKAILKSQEGTQPDVTVINGVDVKDIYISDIVPLVIEIRNWGTSSYDVEYSVVVLEMEK